MEHCDRVWASQWAYVRVWVPVPDFRWIEKRHFNPTGCLFFIGGYSGYMAVSYNVEKVINAQKLFK